MKRSLWYKRFSYYLLVGLPLAFFVLLPKFLSSESGKYLFLSVLNKETGLQCEIEQLHLSWFGSQTAKKVRIRGIDSESEIFSAEQIIVSGSLPRLLLYRFPKSLTLTGWTLQIDESLSINSPSLYHLDPGSLLSKIERSDITSELGSITMKTIKGSTLSVSGFYVKKTAQQLLIRALTKENDIQGSVSVEGALSPHFLLNVQLSSVPASLFKLFIASPSIDRILSTEDLINLTAKAHQEKDSTLITLTTEGNQITAKLRGHIRDNTFLITQGGASSIVLQPAITSSILSELLAVETSIRSKEAHLFISDAKLPLSISKWNSSEFSLQANLPQISVETSDPNLSIQTENTKISVKKSDRFTLIRSSSAARLGGASPSYIHGSLSIDNRKHSAEFHIQQSLLPHTYLRALLPKPFEINIPLEVPYYTLDVKGKYRNTQLSCEAFLDNPLLRLSCTLSGPLQTLQFNGEGAYTLSERWKDRFSPYFLQMQTSFSGKMHFTQRHIFFPKLSVKLFAGENEVFIHGKFGKANEEIKPSNTSLLVYGNLFSLPMDLCSSKFAPLQMTHSSFSLHSDGGKGVLKGNLKLSITDPEFPHLSETKLLIPDIVISSLDPTSPWDAENISIQASGELLQLPVDRLIRLQHKDASLSRYIGETGKASFQLLYSPDKEETISIASTFKTDALTGDFRFVMDSSLSLTENTYGSLQWEVSPERYSSFFEKASSSPSCLLHRPTTFRLALSKISCSDKKTGYSCLSLLSEGGIEGKLSSTPLVFYDHLSKENFIVNNINGSVHAQNLNDLIQYKFTGNCLAPNQDNKSPVSFVIEGEAKNILMNETRSLTQTATWTNIPTSFITGIVPISPGVRAKLTSLAGPKIHISIYNDFYKGEGPLTIKVDSENLTGYLPLELTEHAILLKEDLTASLHINEEINKAFLREFNPLISEGGAYSKHPVSLRVNPQNFYLPIKPYSFENFRIQSASLDFGKIEIENTGTMQDLFQFLDVEAEQQRVESWFTPIFFSVQNGQIIYKRFDALIDGRIRLALWGKTDVIRDRLAMTLGIDPELIKKLFRNTMLKTKNFFLIKIRGPISSPEIDWSSAYARIALLKSYTIAGPLNSLADKLFSSLGEPTPSQTVSPLPWEVSESE
ncbi:hypothetical protein FTM59_02165 [Chlamydia trachomatis]|uniref:Membrane protein n=1 Tax=Chlamydia muridarum TaxID=83560 RepID=A0A069ZWX7_CHLMR|nr:hypothetical protein [Chlamydia muridarum]UFT29159.1 hypothetical protein FTN71_02165 [Chlamydia trachomatis]AHH22793.1 membrane protein [Chlamydia muridarum str. Nigg3 CMUT3-5]AHH23718.1 membrane protein [Chlamydia muridarum str. Nigg CM972]AID37932.1 membrane protein [Chlamydia muridarum str. Nigg 2 MCR]AIT90598.1 membrane protein [Chlamydia muridarum]